MSPKITMESGLFIFVSSAKSKYYGITAEQKTSFNVN